MRLLKIAQIGVGYWGPNLLRNLMSNQRCHVTAAVDQSQERLDYVHRLYPAIRVSDNAEDILQDPHIEAVVIATPVATHYDLAVK
ncbi:MAG: gfo/Idh/MocA family oxidoreductase, partial [Deltaproteobacteria bacterium]